MKASWTVVGVAVVALGLAVNQVSAAVVMVGLEIAPGQKAEVNGVGGSEPNVAMNLYAYMAGNDTNKLNDGIQILFGALKSSNGGLQGNLSFVGAATMQASGYNAGTQQALDGDADLDVGGTNTQTQTVGWICLSAGSGSTFAPTSDDPNKVFLGTAIFTLTDAAAVNGDTTSISWYFDNKTGVTATKIDAYFMDGGTIQAVVGNVANGILSVGGSPTITFVPEPVTMAVLAIGGMGLLLRRRRKAQ